MPPLRSKAFRLRMRTSRPRPIRRSRSGRSETMRTGEAPFTLMATASSSLPVAFSIVSGPATISGTTLTITGAGSVTVRASQTGNDSYNAAPPVDQTFTVAKGTPSITWSAPAAIVYGTRVGATQLNASATVPGSFVYSPPAGTLLDAGPNQILAVVFTPNDTGNYNTASASVSINVGKADQTITFAALANRTYGEASFTVSATSSSSLPVSFSVVSGPATASGNSVTLTGAGTVILRASQAGNTNYNPAANVDRAFTVAKAVPVITWANPADIVDGTPLGTAQLNATANTPGAFVYMPAAGTVLPRGNAQTLTVTFTPTNGANYAMATATVRINVLNAPPVATPQTVNAGTANPRGITLTATDYESDPLTFAVVNGPSHGALSGTAPNLTYTSLAGYVGADSFTFRASDGSGPSGIATVSINVMTPIATTVTSTVPASGQYSDPVTMTATIGSSTVAPGGEPPAQAAQFKVGTQVLGSAPFFYDSVAKTWTATLTAPLVEPANGAAPTGQMKPGLHVVAATMTGVSPVYTVANPSNKSINIAKEDAVAVTWVGSPTIVRTAGVARLTVSLKETDSSPGDITLAQVQFFNRATNTVIGTVFKVAADGTASIDWTTTPGTYTIGVVVSNYYSRNNTADNKILNVQ